jgi:hypothetical protein
MLINIIIRLRKNNLRNFKKFKPKLIKKKLVLAKKRNFFFTMSYFKIFSKSTRICANFLVSQIPAV